MRLKKFTSLLLVLVLVVSMGLLSGCSGENGKTASSESGASAESGAPAAASSGEKVTINIASASSGGAWYTIGGALADLFQSEIPNTVSSCGPGGGIANVFSVSSNEAQLGFGFPDDVLDAEAGVGDFEGNPLTNVRGVTALYPGVLHIAVASDSSINSIEDLKGKVLCTQQKGNAAEKMIRKVLAVYDMSYDDMSKVNFVSFSDAVDLVKDGHADAIAYMSTFPYASLQDLAESRGVKLLAIDDTHMDKLLTDCPAYSNITIPGGSYKGTDEDVTALGCTTILFTNAEMPEDIVYQMTKAMYEDYDNLVIVNSSMASMTPEDGPNTGITLHPGAEKYYKEIGAID